VFSDVLSARGHPMDRLGDWLPRGLLVSRRLMTNYR
jgi:hypothetical protein